MGIQGLIPFLDKVSCRINISQYKDCCVAVDAYCWLHKGAYTCAEKLAKGEKCDAYVFYCMKYVNMLLSHNIKPILVFDGRHLPAKAGTEKKRRESRDVNRKTAAELLKSGRIDEARNYLRRCVDVTHDMALALIKECRKINVDCIVAPYEADAQLAYLNLQNIAQVVITEDSDLVLFGCSKIVFKMDILGHGLLVERERLHLSMRVRPEDFSFDSFRYMCILSGCDYLPSLPGIGLNKALKFINKTRDPDIHRALRRLPAYLNMTQLRVSDEYRDSFVHADATFRYQPVFDTKSRSLVPLTKPPEGQDPPVIVKEQLPQAVALNLALGNLDPFTLAQVDNFDPDCSQQGVAALQRRRWGPSTASVHPSIWASDFSGFQPPATNKNYFPGTLNCSAVFDVMPLRTQKRPIVTYDVEAEDNVHPSQSELLSMYGDSQSPAPELKRKCTSTRSHVADVPNTAMLVTSSPERNAAPDLDVFSGGEQTSLSPILSQRKSRNPFAKPKQALSGGVGPPGAMGRPNYFSALRKFDGVYPMKVDPDVVILSRSSGTADRKQLDKTEKSPEVLKDVSNTSPPSAAQDGFPDESVLAGYSCKKENNYKANLLQGTTVLAAMEAMQEQVALSSQSAEPGSSYDVQQERKTETELEEIESNRQQREVVTIVKTPEPSFNWSQYTCRKSLSVPKLGSSQAVGRTFKNPFRKEVNSKNSISLVGERSEVGGAGDANSNFSHQRMKVDLAQDEDAADVERPSSTANLSSEDIFKTSQEESELGTPGPCIDGAKCQVSVPIISVDMDVGPSEDALQGQLTAEQERRHSEETDEQLSCGSCDSGYNGSQDQPFKASVLDASKRGIPTARRLGLGRSSTKSAVLPKQNLLAQYGFSKKRKLAH